MELYLHDYIQCSLDEMDMVEQLRVALKTCVNRSQFMTQIRHLIEIKDANYVLKLRYLNF